MVVLGAIAGVVGVAFAALPEGERAIDRLSDVLRAMRDVTTDVEIHTGSKQASGKIVLEYAKETRGGEDKTVRRYVVETRRSTPEGAVREKQVNDGKVLWVERTNVDTGAVKVTRRRVDSEGPVPGGFGPDWRKEMDSWRKKYRFTTLREDTFDGEKVVVVEGILGTVPPSGTVPNVPPRSRTAPDAGEAEGTVPDSGTVPKQEIDITTPDRITLFIATRDDFPRKIDLYFKAPEKTPAGTTAPREVLACSIRFTHLKLNAGVPAGTFDYTLPAGAEFTDVK